MNLNEWAEKQGEVPETTGGTVVYARVSSADQKPDLDRPREDAMTTKTAAIALLTDWTRALLAGDADDAAVLIDGAASHSRESGPMTAMSDADENARVLDEDDTIHPYVREASGAIQYIELDEGAPIASELVRGEDGGEPDTLAQLEDTDLTDAERERVRELVATHA